MKCAPLTAIRTNLTVASGSCRALAENQRLEQQQQCQPSRKRQGDQGNPQRIRVGNHQVTIPGRDGRRRRRGPDGRITQAQIAAIFKRPSPPGNPEEAGGKQGKVKGDQDATRSIHTVAQCEPIGAICQP